MNAETQQITNDLKRFGATTTVQATPEGYLIRAYKDNILLAQTIPYYPRNGSQPYLEKFYEAYNNARRKLQGKTTKNKTKASSGKPSKKGR